MDEIKFNSLQELYNRVKPALNTKRHELISRGYTYITNKDIWNYLTNYYWTNSQYLSLCEMVDDILNMNNDAFIKHMNNIISKDIERVETNE